MFDERMNSADKFGMDATATIHAFPSLPFRITKENSREFARMSWEARRAKQAKREEEARKGREATPQSERLAKQIERIEAMMDKSKDADDLQKLSATHARLFYAWQVLTGTPNPGSRRAGRKDRPSMPVPEPEAVKPEEAGK